MRFSTAQHRYYRGVDLHARPLTLRLPPKAAAWRFSAAKPCSAPVLAGAPVDR